MKQLPIGNTGLSVTPLCFGASGLGNMPDTYGYEVDESQARETLQAIFDGPVNFLDTANNYGFGRSEQRIGDALRERVTDLYYPPKLIVTWKRDAWMLVAFVNHWKKV